MHNQKFLQEVKTAATLYIIKLKQKETKRLQIYFDLLILCAQFDYICTFIGR